MSRTILTDGDEGVQLIIKNAKPKRVRQRPAAAQKRQPVHVIYGGAHLFRTDTPRKLGDIALRSLAEYAPDHTSFALAMGIKDEASVLPAKKAAVFEKMFEKDPQKARDLDRQAWLAITVYRRVEEKLRNEPVEDLRIDLEDGYGFRPDDEEDAHASAAAEELALAFKEGRITPFCGFRIKAYSPETGKRAKRTLYRFMDSFLAASGGKLPENFVVTLPKASSTKEVSSLCRDLKKIEKKARLSEGSVGVEIIIEHPLALFDKDGKAAMRCLVDAAKGRCSSAHFGIYDYTASIGIASPYQHLWHDSANFVRQMMLASLRPAGIRLSDSVTSQLPIAVHKGDKINDDEKQENLLAVHAGWKTHFENVTRSMANGFYQSWDLHPNQLVSHYAAVYAFFLNTMDEQAARLRNFIDKASQAILTGNKFDDAASVMGIINFFRSGIDCGALKAEEVQELTGISETELRSGSFDSMVKTRSGAAS